MLLALLVSEADRACEARVGLGREQKADGDRDDDCTEQQS